MLRKPGTTPNTQAGRDEDPAQPMFASQQHRCESSPWNDLAYDPEDFNLNAAENYTTGAGSRDLRIDDLVFDPSDETLKVSDSRLTIIKTRLLGIWVSGRETVLERIRQFDPKKAGICLLLALAFAGLMTYLSREPYYVETKVLFIDSGNGSKEEGKSWRSVEREVELLKNSEIMDFLATDTYRRVNGVLRGRASENDGWPQFQTADWTLTDGRSRSETHAEFTQWLQKELSFSSEVSGGVGKVTLRLEGAQPDYLKQVIAAYVAGYAEHRRMLESQSRPKAEPPAPQPVVPEQKTSDPISEQVQKLEMQQHGCQLALQFLDKGTGAFSGFVPDGHMTGISSLVQFQDRIVQLEIKKRSLEVQFTPESREIRSLDLEIQGLKGAMRECLVEQIAFLKKGREQLLARYDRVEKTKSSAAKPRPTASKSVVKTDIPGGQAWFVIRDGLYMLRDKPAITKQPLVVKAGDMGRRFLAYLLPTSKDSAVARTSEGSAVNEQGIATPGKDGRTERAGRGGRDRASGKQNYWECVPASHFGRESLW
jgi:hypothetical protein